MHSRSQRFNLTSRNKRCIFVVTHLFPYPAIRGVELRINKLIRWLYSQGYKVVLVVSGELEEQNHAKKLSPWVDSIYGLQPALRTRLGRRLPGLRRIVWENVKPVLPHLRHPLSEANQTFYEPVPSTAGDENRKKELSSYKLAPLVSKLARKHKPVAVIAEYIFLTDCFALLAPGTLKIIDTLDVFSLKQGQVVKYGIDDPWSCTREEERAYLLRSDVVLAIQDEEARVLREVVPEREVLTVGIDFEVHSPYENIPTNSITVVGSDNPLNVHGLRSFLDLCWPEIKNAHPPAILNVVGKVGSVCRTEDTSVNYFAGVDDLNEVYRQSRVVINPTIAGTGLKVKSVEALAHGKPLVSWPRGVEGLEYSGDPPYITCHSWSEFAGAVIRVLQSEREAQSLSERARAFARVKFNSEAVYAPLRDCLNTHQQARGAQVEHS